MKRKQLLMVDPLACASMKKASVNRRKRKAERSESSDTSEPKEEAEFKQYPHLTDELLEKMSHLFYATLNS